MLPDATNEAADAPIDGSGTQSDRPISATGPADTSAFDIGKLLEDRGGERYQLYAEHLNPQLHRVLRTIGFDRVYTRAQGSYFWDAEGNEYLDMLSGFGVFALGRHHPTVRRALHDVIDLDLADLTQFDAPPLAGILAERLLEGLPHLQRVYFCNSGTESVEAALKFARHATGKHAGHLLPARLPRPHHRLAVGQRRGRVPDRVRPAAARHRHHARRPRRATP